MSRGLAARKIGELFVRDQQSIMFAGVKLFPDSANSYFNLDELSTAIKEFKDKNLNLNVTNINQPIQKHKAAILVIFRDVSTGEKIGFIKYFKSIAAKGFGKWKDIDFKNETGFFRPKSNSFQEHLPIKPSNLIGTDRVLSLEEIKDLVLKNTQDLLVSGKITQTIFEHINQILEAAILNLPCPVLKNGLEYMPAYNKSLAEIIAPISLITGFLSIDQHYEKDKFKNYHIQYSLSQNNKMFDSRLISLDTKSVIDISSKATNGADASIVSILTLLKKLETQNYIAYNGIVEKYHKEILILKTINEFTAIDGPLYVAKDIFNIIFEQDICYIQQLIADRVSVKEFVSSSISHNLLSFMQEYGKRELLMTSVENLHPSYLPGYHLLAAIAKAVSTKINEDSMFDDMVKKLFENELFIQVTSHIKPLNDKDCIFTKFLVSRPSKVKRIMASSSKNYFSTNIKGKIAFKIID